MAKGETRRFLRESMRGINAILGLAIIMLAFLLFFALLFKGISEGLGRDVVLFILGAVSTNLTQVVSYYFGSSKGADDSTKIIGESMRRSDDNDTRVIEGTK